MTSDVAITWHPFDRNRVSNDIWQAQDIKNYTFHGLSSHAAKAPEKGRSALDAAELMNVGVNYLREHVLGDVRGVFMPTLITAFRQMLFRISRRQIISSAPTYVPAPKMQANV